MSLILSTKGNMDRRKKGEEINIYTHKRSSQIVFILKVQCAQREGNTKFRNFFITEKTSKPWALERGKEIGVRIERLTSCSP